MAEKAADNLAADTAAHAGLMAKLRRRQEAIAASSRHSLAGNSKNQPTITVEELTANDAAAINAAGPEGLSPLVVACLHGSVEDVDLLLTCGADPAAECDVFDTTDENEDGDKCKEFLLSIAAREGHEAIVEVLLAHGSVDLNQASSDFGETALYVSCNRGTSTMGLR